jgi:gamma-glutamyltranspeptidase/glutathione hydrolase
LLTLLLTAHLGVTVAAVPPPVHGHGGAVAAEHPLATEAGLDILRAGGNAADAAVATALALAVVFPEAGNLGGGGFAVVRFGERVSSLDFREEAPASATADMYLDESGEPVRERSLVGPLAAGVPGSPAGLYELHRELGALPWAVVVEPARRLAHLGFEVDEHLHRVLAEHRSLLERFPESAAVWLPGGEPPPVGSWLRLPDLADTLNAYAKHGPEAIASGRVAEAVEEASRRHGGILTAADLRAYQPRWREPVRFQAFGWEVASMSLPSSGGIILGQVSQALERMGWADLPRFGAQRAHLLTEMLRRAYADRYLLGDPETTKAQPAELLAPKHLTAWTESFDPGQATESRQVRSPAASPVEGSADTTHLSVIDADGNLVALTTTINGLFGCGLYVPEAGFFLNNEMDDFAAAPGRPNLFGLVQGEANKVRPGRRMLSSMSPTVAWNAEGAAVAVGGRGGSRIPTNTLQVLLHLIVDGDDLSEAQARPRLHHQWLPDHLEAEPDALAPETRGVLETYGHTLQISARTAKVVAVWRGEEGELAAATDPRGTGTGGVLDEPPGKARVGKDEEEKAGGGS